jgi:hypothetical protein
MNISAPSIVIKRAGFHSASSLILITVNHQWWWEKRTENLTTLSLLKAKIPAEAEFMQTSLNYGGSCNILLYATMNQHS